MTEKAEPRCEICEVPITDENRGRPICLKEMVVCKGCKEYTICNECAYGYHDQGEGPR